MFEVRYDFMTKDNGGVVIEEYRSEFFEQDDGEAVANLLDELEDDPSVFCVEVLENGVQTYLDLRDKNRVESFIKSSY